MKKLSKKLSLTLTILTLLTFLFSSCSWLKSNEQPIKEYAVKSIGAGVTYALMRGESDTTLQTMHNTVKAIESDLNTDNVNFVIQSILDYLLKQFAEKSSLKQSDKDLISAGITFIKSIDLTNKKAAVKYTGYFLEGARITLDLKLKHRELETLADILKELK
jgi:hypothetical protein